MSYVVIRLYAKFIVGCLIQDTAVKGGTIKNFTEVPNRMDCNTKCKQSKECSMYVYNAVRCFMKSDNTFGVQKRQISDIADFSFL